MNDSHGTSTNDEATDEQPKATSWLMFTVAIALCIIGAGGFNVGLHFNSEALVTASVVPWVIANGILIVLHGRLH
jgi:hypothetical protein